MKDENYHIVRTQQYQIQLEDEKDAYAFQTKVSQLQYRVINDLLDRILSDYSEKGYLIQFNEVVLDLGTMDTSNWENEIAYRIEEQLTRFLQSAIWENGSLRTGKKIKIRHHDIEMLEHFLLHGYVSWNHPVHTRPVILFSQLISQQDKALSVLLNNLGKKEVVRKRLISQFDDATLDKTVLAVTDNQQQYIIHYREQITMYHKENKLADTSAGNFRNALWEIILAFVFTETTGYYNRKIFVKYILEKIAQKYRIGYTVLLNTMHNAMIVHRQKMYSDVEFEKMISELYYEDTRQEILYPDTDSTESKDKLKFIEVERILNYFLQHGSLPLNCGIKDIDEFLVQIRKDSTSNPNTVQFPKLVHQAHELLVSLPLLSDTAISKEVVDSISILQKRTLTSSEEYFNNVMGIPALSIFLKTLNASINRHTNDVAVRNELIEMISKQALSIHLDAEVLMERLIVFLKGNLNKSDWRFISSDLLFYLDIIYVGSAVDKSVQINATEQAFDEQFIQDPINMLLFRINAAMFTNSEKHNFKNQADEILRQYVSTYGINRVLLVQQLKIILHKQRSYFPAQAFHKKLMAYLNERSGKQLQPVDTTSINFSLDLLKYYTAYGKIPFWAHNTDLLQIREHVERLAKKAPDLLQNFLKDNGRALMQRMPHADYLLILRSLEYVDLMPDYVFQIQVLIEKCISQKLVTVWPEAKKIRRFFRRFFLEQILCNGSVLKNKEKLIEFCIHEIAQHTALDSGEILQLLIQQKRDFNAAYSYDSELWATYASAISSVLFIEKNKNTEDDHLKTEDADLLQLLEMFNDKKDVVLQDRAYLFNRIASYSKANPSLFLGHLRQMTIRKKIVENISRRNLVHLLVIHTDDQAKKIIQASVMLFKHVQKFLTGTQSNALWKLYAEALLMKLAIDGGHSIREKDVVWMFYKSMTMILQKGKTVAILSKLDTMIMSVPLTESERKLLKRIQSGFEKSITAPTEKISLNPIQKKNNVLTEEDLMGESIFLTAAGIIILGPFIPMLFAKANVVSVGAFIDEASKIKSIQLLHYAVFGNVPMEESDTVLFKLLCGMDLETPFETDRFLSEEEQQLIDGLLNTVIQQWSILKSTSRDGLRETFLKREGKLQIEEEEYILHVAPKAYDMLLDHIPWSISKIKFSWMKKMISVQWRQ